MSHPTVDALKAKNEGRDWATSTSQDSASGSRGSHGYQPSAISLNAEDPAIQGNVVQVMGHVDVGYDGRDSTKQEQLGDFKNYCRDVLGLPAPPNDMTVVDHAAMGISDHSRGCFSHKISNTVACMERVLSGQIHGGGGDDDTCPLKKSLRTLATAGDAGATSATTASGRIERAYAAILGGGRVEKGFALQRERGTRYGWSTDSSGRVLSNYDELSTLTDREQLRIPGSAALTNLLHEEDYQLHMACSTLIGAWMRDSFDAFKGKGVKNIAECEAKAGPCKTKLQQLLCTGQRVDSVVTWPGWVTARNRKRGGDRALTIVNASRAMRGRFRRTMKAVVAAGLATWER
eukprot:TRINITY_DN2062_c0_g2_i1.p1 TRINITY_DN2062_c0_g2~~TRINITY_DN2062_c0_g2_i1.p1  ORF type:complete len:347 (-),score=21.83 TRINITY_DN2062_c0_g2_i1:714-1754(-)